MAEVVVPLPLDNSYTYKLPQNLIFSPRLVGARVMIPFGKRGKSIQGFISGPASDKPRAGLKIKEIERLVDTKSLFTPTLYKVLCWAAEYYCTPLGQVLDTALPSALRSGKEAKLLFITKWRLSTKGHRFNPKEFRSENQRRLWEILKQPAPSLENTEGLGEGDGGGAGGESGGGAGGESAHELSSDALNAMSIPAASISALKKKGLIVGNKILKTPQRDFSGLPYTKPILNQEQQDAAAKIIEALGGYKCFLLDGVTNSGKTEVYIEVIRKVLERGEQAIYLVPEIGLSPQSLERLEKSLAIPLGVIHSSLTPSERMHNYLMMRDNQLQVLIGTRLASFTPLAKPGCIIIDEEHDSSYKQASGFRYNSKHLLIKLATELKIPIVLGSATPSLESLHNAAIGKYTKLRLSQTINKAPPPQVKFVSLKGKRELNSLTPEVTREISDTLKQGGQALVFINRRGFAPVLRCAKCQWQQLCSSCDRPMTLHRVPPYLSCHLCEIDKPVPTECPECDNKDLTATGIATQRIEELLAAKFPKEKIHRIDRDTMRKRDSFKHFYQQVQSSEPCILVGTQMLAKGHDFTKLSLAVILNAETGIFSSDFHTVEQLAQLITQVIGRVGRRDGGGDKSVRSRIVIPIYHTEGTMLKTLVLQGYAQFATKQLEERKRYQLPPYNFMAYLRCEAASPEMSHTFLQKLKQQQVAAANKLGVKLFGPLEASIAKQNNLYRHSLVIKSASRRSMHQVLKLLVAAARRASNSDRLRWHLDLDPVESL